MPLLPALLHEKRFHGRWRLLLAALAGVTAWFAFMPADPNVPADGSDKIEHVLAFGALATAAAFCTAAGALQSAIAAVCLVAYGGFIEVVQSFLPTRQADWADLLADAVGVAGGLLLAALLRRWWPAPGP
jgi:VanZ family protein